MNQISVDHEALFRRIAAELPADLLEHLFVVGSLAAACHYKSELNGAAVKTKDADLVLHPAGHVESAEDIAERLLALKWRRRDDCFPRETPEPADDLRAIRLYPPDHEDYFVELLAVPSEGQVTEKEWLAVRLDDGWYGVPCFEFLGLTAIDRERSPSGLEYASPCMMALASLLSHQTIGTARMSTPIDGRPILRAAKDLGRVVALARLAGRDRTEEWANRWRFALERCFPDRWRDLATNAGKGLRELLANQTAFEEAWFTCNVGILSSKNVTVEQLRITAERLMVDAIEPLEEFAE